MKLNIPTITEVVATIKVIDIAAFRDFIENEDSVGSVPTTQEELETTIHNWILHTLQSNMDYEHSGMKVENLDCTPWGYVDGKQT